MIITIITFSAIAAYFVYNSLSDTEKRHDVLLGIDFWNIFMEMLLTAVYFDYVYE